MRASETWLGAGLLGVLTLTPRCGVAQDDTAPAIPLAQKLVQSALQLELQGDNNYRQLTLKQAVEQDPHYAPAHWHLGELCIDNEWTPVVDLVTANADDDTLREYSTARNRATESAAGEANLARWCEEVGFADRAWLHWHRVLANPNAESRDRRAAAKALKLQQVGDMILDDRQAAQLIAHREQLAEEFQDWSKKIDRWSPGLRSQRETKRAKALAELREVRDPGAVLALELLLSPLADWLASEVITVLEQIKEFEASESLARHAIGAPWPEVAQQAAVALKFRPKHQYVPLLLEALDAPIQTSFQVTGRGTKTRLERTVAIEGRDSNYLLSYVVRGYAAGDRGLQQISACYPGTVAVDSSTVIAAQARLRRQAQRQQAYIDNINDQVGAQNERTLAVLETATNEVLPDNPVAWWNWWEEHNEVNDEYAVKPTRYDLRVFDYVYSQDVDTGTYRDAVTQVDPRPRPRMSCFRAGTPVTTETGRRSIEMIRTGDRVLSQDAETGQLAFKVVIERTLRPPRDILGIRIDGELIECTKGHPFWVNGKGWRMAKLIEVGDQVHTLQGAAKVDAVSEQPYEDEAYNLVVDDFGTYFVGESAALVHDNTYRKPTTAIVPGLH